MDRGNPIEAVLAFLFILVLCLFIATEAHCKTTHQHRTPSNPQDVRGVLVVKGLLVDAFPIEGTPGAVLRLFPWDGNSTTDILICDLGQFNALALLPKAEGSLFTFTFSTRSHRTIQDIGCHDVLDITGTERMAR